MKRVAAYGLPLTQKLEAVFEFFCVELNDVELVFINDVVVGYGIEDDVDQEISASVF